MNRFNVFHELPLKDKGLIMLPVGMYYNRDIQYASIGDTIVFLGGKERIIKNKCLLDLRAGATDFLCQYIYNKSLNMVFRKWLTNAVISGNGRNAVSKNRCLVIWYEEKQTKRT